MATYYIGADVHSNNTELAVENRHKIVARYSVPTTIPAISTVLNSLQGKKILAMEEWLDGFIAIYANQSMNWLFVNHVATN
jgi:hypothetical protein